MRLFAISILVPSFCVSKTALLLIDVQDCFLDNTGAGNPGSLPVANTTEIIPVVNELRESCLFDVIVRSQDFHPEGHISFGPTHGLEPFAHLAGKGELPITCVLPTSGLEKDAACCPSFHLEAYDCEEKLCPNVEDDVAVARVLESPACSLCQTSPDECFETTQAMWTNHCLQEGDAIFPTKLVTADTDIVVQKGGNMYVDSYSAFMDNSRKLSTELRDILKEKEVDTLYVAGIATDYCVYFTVLDALELEFEVKVIEDASRGISSDGIAAALADMQEKGAQIVQAADVLAMTCTDMPASSTHWMSTDWWETLLVHVG